MTSLTEIQLTCPVCGNSFQSTAVLSLSGYERRTTDFQEFGSGTQPLRYLVHSCAGCGYSGAESDFGGGNFLSPMLQQRVRRELAPQLGGRTLLGSEKYEASATIAEWLSADPRQIGDLLLRAAWCCVEEGDHETERYFRRRAAWCFEEALARVDADRLRERAALTYLIGELWRRIGDTGRARRWFDLVPGEVVDWAGQQWIIDLARQQRDTPKDWID